MNEKQTAQTIMDLSIVRPTKKQKELLGFIEGFIAEHGYSPSYREIMNGLQYTSVATVALHVGNLIKRGHLRKRDHSARSLEVVHQDTTNISTVLKTNEIKAGDERWLVEKIENMLLEAETASTLEQDQVDNVYILQAALRILGLDGAAQSFAPRIAALKKLQTKSQ